MLRLNRRFSGVVFIAFYALFGYAISFELTTADSYRIGAVFCQQDFNSALVWQMYKDGSLTDVYLIFVYAILKQYTSNPKVLFGVLGLVMGIFSYLSIKQLYTIRKDGNNRHFYLIAFLYMLAVSFFNVNGIRFWTATSVFSYYVLQYLYFNKKYAIVGVMLTPLIHFGYIIAVIAFAIYLIFIKSLNSTRICYIMMLASFTLHFATPQSTLDDIMGGDGDIETLSTSAAINTKIKNYSRNSENLSKGRKENTSLYQQANSIFTRTFDIINKVGMFCILSLLYLRRRKCSLDPIQTQLFNYVLFSFAIGYSASLLIGSGSRFLRLSNMIFLFWFLSAYQENISDYRQGNKWKKYLLWLIPINFYSISFLFFNAPRIVTPIFWYAPPFFTILDGIGFAPIDFV